MRTCRWRACEAPKLGELTQIYEFTYYNGSRRVFAHEDTVNFYHRIEYAGQVKWRNAHIDVVDEVPL